MKIVETETHHNQGLTSGAARRTGSSVRSTKKMVALQLNDKEHAAFKYLGGVEGLKALLCPEGLCIHCRQNAPFEGSWLESLCPSCEELREASNDN